MSINVIAGSLGSRETTERPRHRARGLRAAAAAATLASAWSAAGAAAGAAAPAKPAFKPLDVFDLQWVADPRISPDGRRIAYVRMRMDIKTDRAQGAVWITNSDGSGQWPLSGPDDGSHPRWSPDGTRIAYLSTAGDGTKQLFVHWFDGNTTAAISSRFAETPSSVAWSPDGRFLAFPMPAPAEHKPLKVELPEAPKGAKWAAPPKLYDRMVIRVDGEGYLSIPTQLFVVPSDGGPARQLTHGDFDHQGEPSWSRDGSRMLIAANRRADADFEPIDTEIYRVDLADGSIHALTDRRGPTRVRSCLRTASTLRISIR